MKECISRPSCRRRLSCRARHIPCRRFPVAIDRTVIFDRPALLATLLKGIVVGERPLLSRRRLAGRLRATGPMISSSLTPFSLA